MRWMQQLKRVFHIDIEHSGMCGGTLRVIACIETPLKCRSLIETILTHLAARETGGINHPRAGRNVSWPACASASEREPTGSASPPADDPDDLRHRLHEAGFRDSRTAEVQAASACTQSMG